MLIKKIFLFLKARNFNPVIITSLVLICIKKILKIGLKEKEYKQEEIDVVIPTISKDYILINKVIDSLKYVKQNINKIYIISNNNEEIRNFCKLHNIVFVNEDLVLGYNKSHINYNVFGIDRSGWIFQQLLKLASDKIVEKENFLILDSDTFFIKDISFIKNNGKFCLQQSCEWHQKYFDVYKILLQQKRVNTFSCVSHMMLFNKKILSDLKSEIEKKNNKTWDRAILDLIDDSDTSYFSEYETYANFVKSNYSGKVYFKVFFNKAFKRDCLYKIDIKKYSKKYNSLSFHEYMN